MNSTLLILTVSFALGGPVVHSSFGQAREDKRAMQLETEKRKLSSIKDPADRAESLMKIADIALTYVNDAITAKDLGKVKSSVEDYLQVVKDARDTMMVSRLDPYKKPKGYKVIELGIRKQLRILEDASRRLAPAERQPLDEAMEAISKTRDELIRVLFR